MLYEPCLSVTALPPFGTSVTLAPCRTPPAESVTRPRTTALLLCARALGAEPRRSCACVGAAAMANAQQVRTETASRRGMYANVCLGSDRIVTRSELFCNDSSTPRMRWCGSVRCGDCLPVRQISRNRLEVVGQ